MGNLKVHLEGSSIYSCPNCYMAQSGETCINTNGGLDLDKLNAIVLDSPQLPGNRNTYSINLSDFLPLMVDAESTCGGYYTDNYAIEEWYSRNKKINEANIPYIHGELVNKGTIPSDVLPTTQYLGSATSNQTVMTKRAALGLISQTARAISYDNGWINLWGYGDDGNLYIISSAQIVTVDEETATKGYLEGQYPLAGGQ